MSTVDNWILHDVRVKVQSGYKLDFHTTGKVTYPAVMENPIFKTVTVVNAYGLLLRLLQELQ